jgi:type IV secretory pathway VirB6-like protein
MMRLFIAILISLLLYGCDAKDKTCLASEDVDGSMVSSAENKVYSASPDIIRYFNSNGAIPENATDDDAYVGSWTKIIGQDNKPFRVYTDSEVHVVADGSVYLSGRYAHADLYTTNSLMSGISYPIVKVKPKFYAKDNLVIFTSGTLHRCKNAQDAMNDNAICDIVPTSEILSVYIQPDINANGQKKSWQDETRWGCYMGNTLSYIDNYSCDPITGNDCQRSLSSQESDLLCSSKTGMGCKIDSSRNTIARSGNISSDDIHNANYVVCTDNIQKKQNATDPKETIGWSDYDMTPELSPMKGVYKVNSCESAPVNNMVSEYGGLIKYMIYQGSPNARSSETICNTKFSAQKKGVPIVSYIGTLPTAAQGMNKHAMSIAMPLANPYREYYTQIPSPGEYNQVLSIVAAATAPTPKTSKLAGWSAVSSTTGNENLIAIGSKAGDFISQPKNANAMMKMSSSFDEAITNSSSASGRTLNAIGGQYDGATGHHVDWLVGQDGYKYFPGRFLSLYSISGNGGDILNDGRCKFAFDTSTLSNYKNIIDLGIEPYEDQYSVRSWQGKKYENGVYIQSCNVGIGNTSADIPMDGGWHVIPAVISPGASYTFNSGNESSSLPSVIKEKVFVTKIASPMSQKYFHTTEIYMLGTVYDLGTHGYAHLVDTSEEYNSVARGWTGDDQDAWLNMNFWSTPIRSEKAYQYFYPERRLCANSQYLCKNYYKSGDGYGCNDTLSVGDIIRIYGKDMSNLYVCRNSSYEISSVANCNGQLVTISSLPSDTILTMDSNYILNLNIAIVLNDDSSNTNAIYCNANNRWSVDWKSVWRSPYNPGNMAGTLRKLFYPNPYPTTNNLFANHEKPKQCGLGMATKMYYGKILACVNGYESKCTDERYVGVKCLSGTSCAGQEVCSMQPTDTNNGAFGTCTAMVHGYDATDKRVWEKHYLLDFFSSNYDNMHSSSSAQRISLNNYIANKINTQCDGSSCLSNKYVEGIGSEPIKSFPIGIGVPRQIVAQNQCGICMKKEFKTSDIATNSSMKLLVMSDGQGKNQQSCTDNNGTWVTNFSIQKPNFLSASDKSDITYANVSYVWSSMKTVALCKDGYDAISYRPIPGTDYNLFRSFNDIDFDLNGRLNKDADDTDMAGGFRQNRDAFINSITIPNNISSANIAFSLAGEIPSNGNNGLQFIKRNEKISIDLASGWPVKNGRYMYIYVQPLYSGPSYDAPLYRDKYGLDTRMTPDKLFPTKRSLWDAIKNSDTRLISFDSIAGGTKSGSFIAASNGALWTVIADMDGDTSINDHDGKYLDQETQTINGGYYTVKARTKSGQAVSGIMSFISGAGNGLIDIVKNIFFGPAEQSCTTVCQMDQISNASKSTVSTQSPAASSSDLLSSFSSTNTSTKAPTSIISPTDTMIQQLSIPDFVSSKSYYDGNKIRDKIEGSYKCDIEVGTETRTISYDKFTYCEYISNNYQINIQQNSVNVGNMTGVKENNGIKYNLYGGFWDMGKAIQFKNIQEPSYKKMDGIESYNVSGVSVQGGGCSWCRLMNYMEDNTGRFAFDQDRSSFSSGDNRLLYDITYVEGYTIKNGGFGMLNTDNIKSISLVYIDTDYYNNGGIANLSFKAYRPLKMPNLYNVPISYNDPSRIDTSSTCPSRLYGIDIGAGNPKIVDIRSNYDNIPDLWFGYRSKTYDNLHPDIKNLFKEDVSYKSYKYKCSLVEKGTSNEIIDYRVLLSQIKDDADQEYLKLPMKYKNCNRLQCGIYKINVTPQMSSNPSAIKRCIYQPVTDATCWVDSGKVSPVNFDKPIIMDDDYTVNSIVGNTDYTNKIVCNDQAKSCKIYKARFSVDGNGNITSTTSIALDLTDYIAPENVIKANNLINRSGVILDMKNPSCSDIASSSVYKFSLQSNNFVNDIDSSNSGNINTNKLPMKYKNCSNGRCSLFKISINNNMRDDPSIIRKCIYQPVTDSSCWVDTGNSEDASSKISILNGSNAIDYDSLNIMIKDNDYSLSSFVDGVDYTSKIVCDIGAGVCSVKRAVISTNYLGNVVSVSESSTNLNRYIEPSTVTSINKTLNRATSQFSSTNISASTVLSQAEGKFIYNIFSLNQSENNTKYTLAGPEQVQPHVLCQVRDTQMNNNLPDGNIIDALKYVGSTSSISSNCTNLTRVCKGSYQNWEKGLIYRIFSGISGSAMYQALFYMFVILYITITGYDFMQGNSKLASTSEIVKEGVKFSIVVMLASPSGWEFYLNYVIKNAIVFSEYMNRIAVESLLGDSSGVGFAFKPISYPIDFIFNWMTLVRLVSLIFSGTFILGIITFFIILFSFISIFFYALRAIVLYISSLMVLSIYLSIVHLVIIGRMFKITEKWFDTWVAAIITAIAEQFMLFTSLSLYCALISSILESMMSFKVCYRPILVIPLYDWTAGIIDDIPLAYGPKPEAVNAPRLLPSDEFDFSSYSESMQGSVVPDVMTAFKISALSMLGMKMTEYIKELGSGLYEGGATSLGGFSGISNTLNGLANLNNATFDAGHVFNAANKAIDTTSKLGSRANKWLQDKIKQNAALPSKGGIKEDGDSFEEDGKKKKGIEEEGIKDDKDKNETKKDDNGKKAVNNGYEGLSDDGDDIASLFDEGNDVNDNKPKGAPRGKVEKKINDIDEDAMSDAGDMFNDAEAENERRDGIREARKQRREENNKNSGVEGVKNLINNAEDDYQGQESMSDAGDMFNDAEAENERRDGIREARKQRREENNTGVGGISEMMNNEEKRAERSGRKGGSYEGDLSDMFSED